jgi:hypothetical protein
VSPSTSPRSRKPGGSSARRALRSRAARQGAANDDTGLPGGRTNRGPRRIDITDPDELRFWCRELGVAPAELLFVLAAVGPLVDDVKQELARIGSTM